ncbi:MAG TPA: hypothetical protein EYP17_07685 [Candidatus Latescibacteria bacterium]|nr:hypothetical protein [Candidatus Latescibacterota bacterium]
MDAVFPHRALELLRGIEAELAELERQLRERRPPQGRPPSPEGGIATVTLAEIYARQGLISKAMRILEDVALKEPGQRDRARALMERLRGVQEGTPYVPEAQS